jgi:hypothetical protein
MPTGYYSLTDPFGFMKTFVAFGIVFQGSGLSIDGQPQNDNLWVNLPRSTYAKLQGGKKFVLDQQTLTKLDAPSFVRFFKTQSNGAQIPWILGPASLIPVVGAVLTIATSTIDGLQRIGLPPINSDQLAILMADGGSFTRTIAEEMPSRLTATTFYTIEVGNEARMYGVCSATYGLNIVA